LITGVLRFSTYLLLASPIKTWEIHSGFFLLDISQSSYFLSSALNLWLTRNVLS
jgi:hypothetical protein